MCLYLSNIGFKHVKLIYFLTCLRRGDLVISTGLSPSPTSTTASTLACALRYLGFDGTGTLCRDNAVAKMVLKSSLVHIDDFGFANGIDATRHNSDIGVSIDPVARLCATRA